jgi:hypothetical protein
MIETTFGGLVLICGAVVMGFIVALLPGYIMIKGDYKRRMAEIAAMTDEQRANEERKLDEKYAKLRNERRSTW